LNEDKTLIQLVTAQLQKHTVGGSVLVRHYLFIAHVPLFNESNEL